MYVAKRDFAARQVELPHPAETLVVGRFDLVPVAVESAHPFGDLLGVMQAENFEIGDLESDLLDRGQRFRQGRSVAAREDIFAQPGIGRARLLHAADGVEDEDIVILEQIPGLFEILEIVLGADMLEHPD